MVDSKKYSQFFGKRGLQNNLWYSHSYKTLSGTNEATLYINLNYLKFLCIIGVGLNHKELGGFGFASFDKAFGLPYAIKALFETYDTQLIREVLKDL